MALTPAELEFIAENEIVDVVPHSRLEQLELIAGEFGPFRPPLKAKVPLWMAVEMKRCGMCTISPPDWLKPEFLEQVLLQERGQVAFAPVPPHFLEISSVLLENSQDSIQGALQMRRMIDEIRDARQNKIARGLNGLKDITLLQANNLTAAEANVFRPFFSRAAGVLEMLRPK